MKPNPKRIALGLLTAVLMTAVAPGARLGAALEEGFARPPAAARPWVYWFPLSGNLTKAGITADLEAMARVGIGGVLYMEVDQGAPKGAADFAGPLWMEMIGHACREASRLGLEINMHNDAGWNGSGGPWITPELSMQKVVWSEVVVDAAAPGPILLKQPRAVNGFYQDIAVLAMPAPSSDFRIPEIAGKSAFRGASGSNPNIAPMAAEFPKAPDGAVIPRDAVVDVTRHLGPDGTLAWTPPPGKWLVMRLGRTTTGAVNAPAPMPGRGLECDKLSKQAAAFHFEQLMGKIIQQNKALTGQGKTLVGTHIDSWEIGAQNWTPRMREEFRKRRGYELWPFLPAFAGRVIGSTEVTERFLWDLRQTVSELLLENYAGAFHELARASGLRLSIEAYDEPADNMAYAGRADEPMGEFWAWGKFGRSYNCTEMASAGHAYGKRIIGAEAFTADNSERWQGHPASIKDLGDWAFCEGINRFVFHRYAAQPWVKAAPGMSMGPWGLHYERTQTWWEQSKAWHLYLARCQHLLRQGLFAADIAYLTPEGAPREFKAPPEAEIAPHIRGGYGFDACSPEVVLTRMSVKNGRIVLPDGMSYRLLVLPEVETMTPALLAKIQQLADAGAAIAGSAKPPRKAPGLSDMGAGDEQVRARAAALWASGKILTGKTAHEHLAALGVPPDFSSTPLLRHIHRQTADADLYFVANPQPTDVNAVASFRVSGRQPELWRPDSGRMETLAAFQESGGVTRVPLRLEPSGSVFVVFRKAAGGLDPVVALGREGRPLWSLEKRGPAITIAKAAYGVPGDPQRTRDVTQKLQRLVDAGQTRVPVAQMASGDDPAYLVVKTLTVEFAVDGEKGMASGADGDVIHLADTLKIAVAKAAYGVPGDPQRTRDVRAKVQKMVDQGERSFEVRRLAAGDDPAYGVVKTLTIEFALGGQTHTVAGLDGELITLAAPGSAEAQPELRRTPGGGTVLAAGRSGNYELKTAGGTTRRVTVPGLPETMEVGGPWQVQFNPAAGGPGDVRFEKLADWALRPEDGIKYYSGAAVYQTTFVAGTTPANTKWMLDLGRVEVMAEASLNGNDLGILWKPPYRVDVTAAIRPGTNRLELKIVNLWINRQIGDEQLPEDSDRNTDGTLKSWPEWVGQEKPSPTGRLSFTSWRLWKKTDTLRPSGLIGPVRILPVAEVLLP